MSNNGRDRRARRAGPRAIGRRDPASPAALLSYAVLSAGRSRAAAAEPKEADYRASEVGSGGV